MTVYVGIVTHNSLADLPACFAGLRAQSCRDLVLTVLDNASSDGSAEWVRSNSPDTRLIVSPENLGFARGHNRILAACALRPGDFYLPLNPDVQLSPGYVDALVEIIAQTGAGWATGKLLLPSSDTENPTPRLYSVGHALYRNGYPINIGHDLTDTGQFDEPREVFGAPGAATLISAALIGSVAPDGEVFDRSFFMYGEDTDLDWRARRAGWRCWYSPRAVASHRGSSPAEALRIQTIANRYLSVLKNAFPVDFLIYNLPLISAHCLARVVLSPRLGLALTTRLIRLAPTMIRKRRPPQLSRAEMNRWFRWSRNQPTAQPLSWRARIGHALRRQLKSTVAASSVPAQPCGEPFPRLNVLGVNVSAINMAVALGVIEEWITRREHHYVCVTNTHSIMECVRHPDMKVLFNAAGLVTPDGMPLVWLCRMAGLRHTRRVYGPDLLVTLCEQSVKPGYRHYFYGGREGIPELLTAKLTTRFPGVQIAGAYSPPIGTATPDDDEDDVRRINDSGADVVWVALGTSKQERWMAAHVDRLNAPVLIGVGAAFDFLTGTKRQAPAWIRNNGFEWLYRLVTEPRRLWRRYLVDAPLFVLLIVAQKLGLRKY